ncbi:MAG: PDZ domain-containing protein [Myxococcales bacterium]|nr:PDZ domain-containing protein [Myxococcales bacterium]
MNLPSTLFLSACTLLGSSFTISEARAQPHARESVSVTTSRGRLGAQVISISEHLRQYFAAPADAGILVDHVLPGSPAAKAGLATGDVIIDIQGVKIGRAMDVFSALRSTKKGEKVNVKIIRKRKAKTLQVILADSASGHSMLWGEKHGAFSNSPDWKFGESMLDGHRFPMGPMHGEAPAALQEKMRKLEERLDRLEGKSESGQRKTKPSKRLKGASRGTKKKS